MRKLRFFTNIILCMLLLFSISACSSGQKSEASSKDSTPKEEEKKEEPLDLTGNWAQKGAEGHDSYMAGYIRDGVIEIFWMSEAGKSGSLFWSGSYIPPTDAAETYTWDSVNDKIKTEYAIMASGDDTKTFSYENGELSFIASALGQSREISLVRSETDYSVFTPAGGTSGSAVDGQQVQVEHGVYGWVIEDGRCYFYYAAKLHNPNKEYAIERPKIIVTVRGEDNRILKTQEQTLSGIAADDTIMYADEFTYEGPAPASVDMMAENDSRSYMHQEGSGILRQDAFTISNVTENLGEYTTNYTGEVTNNSTLDLNQVRIILVYKKGDEYIGGRTISIDGLRSGETKPFEINGWSHDITHDSYEIYALQGVY